ncbi:MAG: hypothetical protein ACJAZI_001350 [Cycloclasticus sp.]|jgi:hypothetical protein
MNLLNKKFIYYSFGFYFMLVFTPVLAANFKVPTFKAEYTLRHNDIEIGHVDLAVKKLNNGLYQLSSSTKTSGLLSFIRDDDVVEISEFDAPDGRIRPLTYRYSAELGDSQKDISLRFDWLKSTVTNSTEGHDWNLSIKDGVLDKALMQIALMQDVETDHSLQYSVADGGRLKNFVFTRLGSEKISLNGRLYETTKLARKKDDKPLITYYWCASELHNLPILLKRKKSYGTFEMRLEKVTFDK